MDSDLWPRHIAKAKEVQESLRQKVRLTRVRRRLRIVAGVDAAFAGDKVVAVASLFEYPCMRHLEDSSVVEQARFPYVPGYLSFREGHAIITALSKLTRKPDLLLVDGQGIAHPRGIGIASHIGVLLGIPSIGCAKSRLVGEYEEPGNDRGDRAPLLYNGRKVGAVLRTRQNAKPLFISPGHLVDIASSVDIVMRCLTRFRITEPIRRADMISKRLKKSVMRSLDYNKIASVQDRLMSKAERLGKHDEST